MIYPSQIHTLGPTEKEKKNAGEGSFKAVIEDLFFKTVSMPVRELCAARVWTFFCETAATYRKGQTSHVELTTTHTPGLFILPCDPRASLSREVLLYISPSYVPVMQHEPVSPSSGSWSQVLSRSELQTVLSGQLKRNPLPPPAPGSWKASPRRLGAATRRLLDWERSGPKTVRRQIFVRRLSALNYLEKAHQ